MFVKILVLILVGHASWASDIFEDEEFQKKVEYLNERFSDFHIHEQNKMRWNRERRQDAEQMKIMRKERQQEIDAYRREYVKKRKPKPEPLLDDEILAKDLMERKMQRDMARKEYIKQRERVKRIRKRAKSIPEAKEVGLE